MCSSKEIKGRAISSLNGRYWNCFLVSLIQMAITSALAVSVSAQETMGEFLGFLIIGSVCMSILPTLFVDYPLQVGVSGYYLKCRERKTEIGEMFAPFRDGYLTAVGTMTLSALKIFLWSLLFLIPGIIKAYGYAMVPYILAENPEMQAKDTLRYSETIMRGNRWRFFCLDLSFMGWFLLGFFSLGMGYLFLVPYIEAAHAEFYKELTEY